MSNDDPSGAPRPDDHPVVTPVAPIEPVAPIDPVSPPVDGAPVSPGPVPPVSPPVDGAPVSPGPVLPVSPPVDGAPVSPGPIEPPFGQVPYHPIPQDPARAYPLDGPQISQTTNQGPGAFHAMGGAGPIQLDRAGTPPADHSGAAPASSPAGPGPAQASDHASPTPTPASPGPAPSAPTPAAPPSSGAPTGGPGGGGPGGGGPGGGGPGGGGPGGGEPSQGMDVARTRQLAAALEHSARSIQEALNHAQGAVRALGTGWRGADYQSFEREWATTHQTIVADLDQVKKMVSLTRRNADAQQSTSAH